MNVNTDTAISIEFKSRLIEKHISVDICKECVYFTFKNTIPRCTLHNLNKDECNLLKIYT